jgi:hypothetical protein
MSADELVRIDAMLTASQAELPAMANSRRVFPRLSLTRCDESDLAGEQPFREYPQFKLYLVDGSNHCWQLTQDPSRATGVVVTRKEAHA